MTHFLGLRSWATGAVVLAVASACGGTSADPSGSRTLTATPSTPTAGSTSASPSSPEDVAAAGASAVVRKYFATLDRLGQDPTTHLNSLASVTTSTELTAERTFLRAQHRRGERQVGNTRIAHLKVQSVNLDNSDPTAGRVPTVSIDVCWDVSKVDVVDRTGKSIVSPRRADSRWTRYTVANYHYRANPGTGWRVADAQDLRATPCAAS